MAAVAATAGMSEVRMTLHVCRCGRGVGSDPLDRKRNVVDVYMNAGRTTSVRTELAELRRGRDRPVSPLVERREERLPLGRHPVHREVLGTRPCAGAHA